MGGERGSSWPWPPFRCSGGLVEEVALADEFSCVELIGSVVEAMEHSAETALPEFFKHFVFLFLHNYFSIHSWYGFSLNLEPLE